MIETIYEELKRLGAVKTYDEFSCKWLGMERSYMRTMRAKRREPSAKAIARCAARLKNDSKRLLEIDRSGYRNAAARLETLADRCIDEMLRKNGVN